MEKVRFIGSKRRTNTPISYRQRVVQYRHRPFQQHAIYKSEKLSKSESVMNQLIPQKFVEDIKLDENLDKAKAALGDVGGKMKSFFSRHLDRLRLFFYSRFFSIRFFCFRNL